MFKTKEFARFGRREAIADTTLCEAVDRAERGLIDADLGGGLIKQRVARPGEGRSGGYRTLMVYRVRNRCVFVYGFAKSERENIDRKEMAFWRNMAAGYLAMSDRRLDGAMAVNDVMEVWCNDRSGNKEGQE